MRSATSGMFVDEHLMALPAAPGRVDAAVDRDAAQPRGQVGGGGRRPFRLKQLEEHVLGDFLRHAASAKKVVRDAVNHGLMRAQGGFEFGLCHPLLLFNTEGPAVITQNLSAPAVTGLRTGAALAGSQCTRVGGCLSHRGRRCDGRGLPAGSAGRTLCTA